MEYKRLKRLTTDNPDGNFEILMNYCYGKDRIAMLRYAGGKEDIPLHEYVAKLCKEKGCIEDENVTLDDIEEMICDPWGDCCDCSIGVLYYLGCQAVNARGVLKRYEDSGLSAKETQELAKAKTDGWLIMLPCKVGDIVYEPNRLRKIISKYVIEEIIINQYGVSFFRWNLLEGIYSYLTGFPVECLDKTVFLDYREAEKALKEGKSIDKGTV